MGENIRRETRREVLGKRQGQQYILGKEGRKKRNELAWVLVRDVGGVVWEQRTQCGSSG